MYGPDSEYEAAPSAPPTTTRGVNHFPYAFSVASAMACHSATRGSGGGKSVAQPDSAAAVWRSEERRVGKECRYRKKPSHQKKNRIPENASNAYFRSNE